MNPRDLLGLAFEALGAHRLRYGLSALAIAVGVGAVVLMSSFGEGTRDYIVKQVSSFGVTLVSVNPGKVETGGIPGAMGAGARRLTLDDTRAMTRLPQVLVATPVAFGAAEVEYGRRGRRVLAYGVGGEMPRVWSMRVAAGRFFAEGDWESGPAEAVLGPRLRRELFGEENPLGKIVRIGESRFRVVGLMESKGTFLGFDLDDTVYIPVGRAMRLFNLPEVSEIDLVARTPADVDPLVERLRRLIVRRHGGHEDVTIMTQRDGLKMLDNVMNVVTGTVTAIAGISLLVGAIGIFTILWIVVRERTAEIGLLKAIGARRDQILVWYLTEAAVTSALGGAAGLAGGVGLATFLARIVPGLETRTAPGVVAAALLMAVGVGLAAGIGPAVRAANLDPVEALRAEE